MGRVQISAAARAMVRLGLVLLFVAGASSIWWFLASQIPSSAFRADVLPGPVAQLRDAAGFLALLSFAFAWLMPAAEKRSDAKRLAWCLHVGIAVLLCALAYGATTGMLGIQIDDPRTDSRWLLIVRVLGEAILAGSILEFARRIWIGIRASD